MTIDSNIQLHVLPESYVSAEAKLAASQALYLGCAYWGITEPAVRWFSTAGQGADIHGMSRPYGKEPTIWLRAGRGYRETHDTALHEVYHHCVAQLGSQSKSDAIEEEEATFFADSFDRLCAEERILHFAL